MKQSMLLPAAEKIAATIYFQITQRKKYITSCYLHVISHDLELLYVLSKE